MNLFVRRERGQILAFTAVAITGLLALGAFAVDVGAWFRAHRQAQAVADAAALAGAQALPDDPGTATALALQYANSKNSGLVEAGGIAISSTALTNDTIGVEAKGSAPGFFAKIFGVSLVDVKAGAKARSGIPGAARYVAPIAVNRLHPFMQCAPPPCSGETELELANLHQPGGGDAAGNFTLLDLNQGSTGSAGSSELADWMVNGFNDLMPLGIYTGAAGAHFNSGPFKSALDSMMGEEVLLPVYDPPVVRGGSTAQFNIIGWVGFVPTSRSGGGSSGKIQGQFTRFIAQGLLPVSGGGSTDFGVRVVQLVE